MEGEDALLGKVLAERYRVLGPLGKGGMGQVYRVEHVALKKEMALKLLPEDLTTHDEMVRRFEREAEAAARLDHPNIIRVTDFGRTENNTFYLAMELVHGRLLADVMQPGGEGTPMVKIEPRRALHIIEQVARALHHAHSVGVIHRDLKPSNIMIVDQSDRGGDRESVKLLDFGIAKLLQMDDSAEALTQAGLVYGTPEYLSPEQAVGDKIDPRADLYSLGVILYEMISGRLPFESASKLEILHKHVHEKAPPLASVAPTVPDDIADLVEKLLQKQREDRVQSANLLLREIERVDPTPAPAPESLPKNPVLRAGGKTLRGTLRILRRSVRTLRFGSTNERVRVIIPFSLIVVAVLALVLVRPLRATQTGGTDRGSAATGVTKMTEEQQLALVEALLGSGQLAAARASLQQILAAHPDSARGHFLFGHLNYVEGERTRALGDYLRALELDPTLASEPVLASNVRASLDRKLEAGAALELLEKGYKKAGLDELRICMKSCRIESVRRRAQEAADRLEPPPPPPLTPIPTPTPVTPVPVAPVGPDPLAATVEKVKKGRLCKDRRAAALALIATKDARYLPVLKAARTRRGGLFGVEEVNGCMRTDLDNAIRALEETN